MGFKVSVSNRGVVTCHSNQEPVTEAQIKATASQLLKLANGSAAPVQKAKSVDFLRNVLKEAIAPPHPYGAQWTGIELKPDTRDLVADALAAAKEITPERALNPRPFIHTKTVIVDGDDFASEFPAVERGPDIHQLTSDRFSDLIPDHWRPYLLTKGTVEISEDEMLPFGDWLKIPKKNAGLDRTQGDSKRDLGLRIKHETPVFVRENRYWDYSDWSFDITAHESVKAPTPYFPSDGMAGVNEIPRDNASSVAALLHQLKNSDDTKE